MSSLNNRPVCRRPHLLKPAGCLVLLFLLAALSLPTTPTGSTRAQEQSPHGKGKFLKGQGARPVPDQYFVVLKDDIPGPDVDSIADELAYGHGGVKNYVYRHALKGFSIRLPEAAAMALSHDPRVEYVEQDGEVHLAATQSNPPWGLDRIDQRSRPRNNSYTYANTGATVHAYVIDSGIRTTHPQFGGRAIADPGADFVGDGLNGQDCNGHGTHVAGIIGGSTYGVAKNVRLHSVRVFNCSGETVTSSWQPVVAAVDWVTANHIKPAVVNMSLGGDPNQTLDTAIRRSISSGVTYVVAAGNGDKDEDPDPTMAGANAGNFSPSRVAEALTVASVDQGDDRAFTSNFGSVVDVFAPGVGIPTASLSSDTAPTTSSGTSMAAPHVAGAAALYLQTHKTATPKEVGGVIIHTATKDVVLNPGPGSPNRLLFMNYPMGLLTAPLYRYWNPTLTDNFYTVNYRDLEEGRLGWSIEKIAAFAFTSKPTGTVPLYRYWNSELEDHFYTTNVNELGQGAHGWVFEKIECYVYSQQQSGTVPLYRYWNPSIGNHYYTTDFGELGQGANGYAFEWIECYVLPLN